MGTTPSKSPARPEAQDKGLKQITLTNYSTFKGEGTITIEGSTNDLSAFKVKNENVNAILNPRGFLELSSHKRKEHEICHYSYQVDGQFDRGILCDGPGSYSFVIETNTQSFAYNYLGSLKNGCKDGEGSCTVRDGDQEWSYKGHFSQNWFSGKRSQLPHVVFEECDGQFLFDNLSVRFQSSHPNNLTQSSLPSPSIKPPPSPSQKCGLPSSELPQSSLQLGSKPKVIGKLANQHLQLAPYCHYIGDLTNGKHGVGQVKYIIQFSSNDLELVKTVNRELFEQCNIATIMKMCELGYDGSKHYSFMVFITGHMDGFVLTGEGRINSESRLGEFHSYTYQGSFLNGCRDGNGVLTFNGGLQKKHFTYKGHFNQLELTGTRTDHTQNLLAKSNKNEDSQKIKLIYDGLFIKSDSDPIEAVDLNRTVKLSDNLTYEGVCAEDGHDHGHGYGKYSMVRYPNVIANAWPFHPFLLPFTLDNIIKCQDLPGAKFQLPIIETSFMIIMGTFDGHSLSGLGDYNGVIYNGMYNFSYSFKGNFEKGVKMGLGTFIIGDSGKKISYKGNFSNNYFDGTVTDFANLFSETPCKGEFISADAFILFRPCQQIPVDVSKLRIQIPSIEAPEIQPINVEIQAISNVEPSIAV